jgi:hypothetical protein
METFLEIAETSTQMSSPMVGNESTPPPMRTALPPMSTGSDLNPPLLDHSCFTQQELNQFVVIILNPLGFFSLFGEFFEYFVNFSL